MPDLIIPFLSPAERHGASPCGRQDKLPALIGQSNNGTTSSTATSAAWAICVSSRDTAVVVTVACLILL